MRRLWIVWLFLVLSSASFCQQRSLVLGINTGGTVSGINDSYFSGAALSEVYGVGGEISIESLWNRHVFLRGGLGFIQKGYREESEFDLYENSYLNIDQINHDKYI